MMITPTPWNRKAKMNTRSSERQWAWGALITGFLFFLAFGCQNLKQLEEYKTHSSAGDYGWIVAQDVDCDSTSDTCGQLHLIKGDACFNQAKSKVDEKKNYSCAADELEKGIMLNKNWADPKAQLQTHENLCESLRNLQDLQSGEEAKKTLEKLDAASTRLAGLFPGSYAAVYFSAKAQMRKAQDALWTIQDKPGERKKVCQSLLSSMDAVKNTVKKGKAAGGSDWKRYETSFTWLSADLSKAIKLAGCK